jgi:hypothetical protein
MSAALERVRAPGARVRAGSPSARVGGAAQPRSLGVVSMRGLVLVLAAAAVGAVRADAGTSPPPRLPFRLASPRASRFGSLAARLHAYCDPAPTGSEGSLADAPADLDLVAVSAVLRHGDRTWLTRVPSAGAPGHDCAYPLHALRPGRHPLRPAAPEAASWPTDAAASAASLAAAAPRRSGRP